MLHSCRSRHGPGQPRLYPTVVSSHQAVPHYPRVFSSASLHGVHILLFLFSISPPRACLRCLRVWSCLRTAVSCLCILVPGRGHLGHGPPPPRPAWCHTDLRLGPIWAASLVVFSGLLLAWAHLSSSIRGSSGAHSCLGPRAPSRNLLVLGCLPVLAPD